MSESTQAALLACKIVGGNDHHSMQMWSAYCACGWSTVQRDPRWRDDAVLKHLAAGADEQPKTSSPAPAAAAPDASRDTADGI